MIVMGMMMKNKGLVLAPMKIKLMIKNNVRNSYKDEWNF